MPPNDAQATADDVPDALPRWDLSRFGFESPFSDAVDKHLDESKARAILFKEKYEGKLNDTSTCNLFEAINEFEDIAVRRAIVSSYLSLSYDTALTDDALKKRKGALSQLQSEITGDYLEWFELDVAQMSADDLKRHYDAEPRLRAEYGAFLDELRRQRPHNLAKDVERALTVRGPYSGVRPLVSFFDKELSMMKFDLGDVGGAAPGEDSSVNMEVLLSRLSSSKDAAVRAACLNKLNKGLDGSVARIAALSLSSVAGSWLIENKERSYANLRSRRNLDNNVPGTGTTTYFVDKGPTSLFHFVSLISPLAIFLCSLYSPPPFHCSVSMNIRCRRGQSVERRP